MGLGVDFQDMKTLIATVIVLTASAIAQQQNTAVGTDPNTGQVVAGVPVRAGDQTVVVGVPVNPTPPPDAQADPNTAAAETDKQEQQLKEDQRRYDHERKQRQDELDRDIQQLSTEEPPQL